MPDGTASNPPVIDSRVLRRLAEAAVGIPTGKRLFVRLVNDQLVTAADNAANDALFEVASHLPPVAPKTPIAVHVVTEPDDGSPPIAKTLRGFDAFFWSAASIEKFVMPYYLPILGLDRTAELMNEYLRDGAALGIAHGEYSEPDLVNELTAANAQQLLGKMFNVVRSTSGSPPDVSVEPFI